MTIVGFHGQLGSGKDTAGERLAQIVKLPSQRISFAGKLKQSAAALFDLPIEWLEENKNNLDAKVVVVEGYEQLPVVWDTKGTPVEAPKVIREFTIRQYLQRFGTEAHRDVFWYDFWVDQAFRDVDAKVFPKAELVYVTDVRFKNEIAAIRKRGGVVVHILGEDQKDPVHASEIPLEGCDFRIENNVRDDDFANLDRCLRNLARELNLPMHWRNG